MLKKMLPQEKIKAWDPLVRVFHWSLVIFFLIAFVTEDDWLSIHVQAGYTVLLLVVFRLFWGIFGSQQARFRTFIKSPATVLSYLKAMLTLKVPHYLGHNPVAAVMVIALLFSVIIVSLTGMIVIASEGQGPLSSTLFSSWNGERMEDVHEFFANFTALLVLVHVAGVIVSSLLEGENLVKAMITGTKKKREHWTDVNSQEAE